MHRNSAAPTPAAHLPTPGGAPPVANAAKRGIVRKERDEPPGRRVASHQVRNAARCVLSLSLPEHAPLSRHHLRLPHSDESRSMEASLTFSLFLQHVSRRAIRYNSSPHRRDRDGRSFPRLVIHEFGVLGVRLDSSFISCIPSTTQHGPLLHNMVTLSSFPRMSCKAPTYMSSMYSRSTKAPLPPVQARTYHPTPALIP
jgi:hypothetical protein